MALASPYVEEIKLAAIVVAAGLLFAGVYYLGGLGPKAALSALKAEDWQAKQQATQVALDAVQAELKQAKETAANNSAVIQGLQNDNAKITASWAADRDLAQRLLNAAARAPSSSAVPETKGGQPVASASDPASAERIEDMVVAAAQECERTANQLNALISEISPQL